MKYVAIGVVGNDMINIHIGDTLEDTLEYFVDDYGKDPLLLLSEKEYNNGKNNIKKGRRRIAMSKTYDNHRF